MPNRAANLRPISVWIHGGDSVSHEGRTYRVPKRDLVGVLQVLFQSGRIKVAGSLKEGETLLRELQNFRAKINISTGHDSYEAWRESDHDDLVLAVALAAWYAARGARPRPYGGATVAVPRRTDGLLRGFNDYHRGRRLAGY